jgi:uncharacterized membrane protein
VLFTLAGTVTIVSTVLAVLVSRWFLLVALGVGVNELVFAAVGACPASLLLRRACRTEGGT